MEYPVWSFVRGADRLDIGREDVDDGVMLIVAGDGTPRSYFFRDRTRLEIFQRDMETLLLKTGWSFDSFIPERRDGPDRRGWPRKSDDRRRWWTDGVRLPRQPRLREEVFREPRREEEAAPNPKGTRST